MNLSQVTLFEPVAIWVVNSVGDKEMSAGVQEFLTKYRQDASDKKHYACGPVIDFLGGKALLNRYPTPLKIVWNR